jgi:gliding motility-associated-like protein
VADYKILRSVPGRDIFSIVAVSPETENSYIDKNLHFLEGEFVYKIKAEEGPNGYGGESYSNEIVLVQKPHLYIPSAFTPNNDASNDEWGVGSAFVKEIELKVFNRFGQMIFYSDHVENLWDGTVDGVKAPEGVYVYKLTYSGFDTEKTFTKTGTFTLFR